MGSLTNYGENAVANHICRNSAYTPAATVYLVLCTADPNEAATGAACNETANANGYARTAITFGAAATRRVTQNADVSFPVATGNYASPISHWALADSGTYGAGNILAYGAFATPRTVLNGNTPVVRTAAQEVYVEITASTGLSNYAANAMLDRMFRNQAFTIAANYAALATAALTDSTTTPTEVSGGSYARVQVNPNGGGSPAWSTVSGGSFSNNADVNFPTPTASWGTMTSLFFADASSGGNVLWYDNAVTDQAIGIGDTVYIPSGSASFTQS